MEEKFQKRYRIPSARLPNWDYGWNGSYFITICTKGRCRFFGEVKNCEVKLNDDGKIAEKYWKNIPERYNYAFLDSYVIMPDHIHGIIQIKKNIKNCRDAINRVSTKGGITEGNNPMLNDNISRIINWYKGRVTFEIRKKNPRFSWQPRFNDHIIRNKQSLKKIRKYILNNPVNW
ncbi:MAG: transposase [Bacteroidales bacterium]|nr:transposase [Bacteroidales bacterium]